MLLLAAPIFADSFADQQRVKSGVKIFRVILKSDQGIGDKKGKDGALTLLVVGAPDVSPQRLGELVGEMQGSGERTDIAGMPVKVEVVAASGLDGWHGTAGGLFVAEPLPDDQLKHTVQFGMDHHVISFSPFEGDVERGVLCGLSVEAKLLPFINTRTLKASGIAMSPVVLKVAKTHE